MALVCGRADIGSVTDPLPAFLAAVGSYLPAVAYLACVWLLLYGFERVPSWVHLLALAAGLAFRVSVTDAGVSDLLWPFGVAAGVFVALVAVAARTVSGVSLFAISVGLALTPFGGWPGLVLGLGVAAVVAAIRTWRTMGKERVWWLAHDTLSGLGISTAGGLKPPQPEHIPTRDMLMADDGAESPKRMYLPPYLLLGVLVAAATAGWQAGN